MTSGSDSHRERSREPRANCTRAGQGDVQIPPFLLTPLTSDFLLWSSSATDGWIEPALHEESVQRVSLQRLQSQMEGQGLISALALN